MRPAQRKNLKEELKKLCLRYGNIKKSDIVLRIIHREEMCSRYFDLFAEDRKKRIIATKSLCPHKVILCDFHCHSPASDGSAFNIGEISEWAYKSGIDLMAITDHNTIGHGNKCERFNNLIFGQEINVGVHHIVVLGISKKIESCRDDINRLEDKIKEIKNKGGFPIVAHPCGFRSYPYSDNMSRKVLQLKGWYGIEIGNGASNLFDYFDATDFKAIKLWDRLLRQGRRVIAFGNTDAHYVGQLGMVWNGLVGGRLHIERIVERLQSGRHFVSDAPFIFLEVNNIAMGDKLEMVNRRLDINIEAYDSFGLAEIRLLKNGKLIKKKDVYGKATVKYEMIDINEVGDIYYRAEVYSKDFRRGYTNPVWVRKDKR